MIYIGQEIKILQTQLQTLNFSRIKNQTTYRIFKMVIIKYMVTSVVDAIIR